MRVAYWIIAGLLAAFFLYAGGKKVAQNREQLRPMMGWVDRVPMPLVRTIGVLEILGAARPDPAGSDRSRVLALHRRGGRPRAYPSRRHRAAPVTW